MIALLNRWIIGAAVVSLAVAVAETMVTQEGMRQVLRLAGGILLLVALLNPVLHLDEEDMGALLEDSRQSVQELEETYGALRQEQLAAVIAEETAAYISDKTEEMGLSCEVEVEVKEKEDGMLLPGRVRVNIPYHEELSRWLESQLDIPAEQQIWQEE